MRHKLQLLAEDPDEFVQRLKKRLALKEGIPESQQRLVFSVSSEQGCTAAPAAEKAAEEIVGELHSWQVKIAVIIMKHVVEESV